MADQSYGLTHLLVGVDADIVKVADQSYGSTHLLLGVDADIVLIPSQVWLHVLPEISR